MTKVLEDWRENGLKISLPLRFLYVNFKVSQRFQILIGLSPERANGWPELS